MKPINTERLLLIPLSLPQLEISLYSARTLADSLGIPIVSQIFEEPAEHAIKMKVAKMDAVPRNQHPWFTYWLIVIKEKITGAGLVGFKGSPDENGVTEIGYGIDERYQRQGYMTEAVKALIEWAFNHPECLAITATGVLKNNRGSQKVLKKAGFTEVAFHDTSLDYKLERMEVFKA
jgi:ribosomal-protein-alanine N-acetyltransferase